MYFCGVDKKAVSSAITLKYNEIIKFNEYLENIFDITFNMPISSDVTKIVQSYFKSIELNFKKTFDNCSHYIGEFFNTIDFKNPRHIKKFLIN